MCSIYDNKYIYILSKTIGNNSCLIDKTTLINEECECVNCTFNMLYIKDLNSVKYCNTCLEDMELYKNKQKSNFIEPKCNIYCLWWDWFDHKRQLKGCKYLIKWYNEKKILVDDYKSDNKNIYYHYHS